jgi:hypothetical protein
VSLPRLGTAWCHTPKVPQEARNSDGGRRGLRRYTLVDRSTTVIVHSPGDGEPGESSSPATSNAVGPDSEAPGATPKGWVRRLPSAWALAPALALVFYALLRLDLALFYANFHVSPEDVGLSYADVLQIAALSVVGFAITVLISVATVVFASVGVLVPAFIVGLAVRQVHWMVYALAHGTKRGARSTFMERNRSSAGIYLILGGALYLGFTIAASFYEQAQRVRFTPPSQAISAVALFIPILFYLARNPVPDQLFVADPDHKGLFRVLVKRAGRVCAALVVLVLVVWLPVHAALIGRDLAKGQHVEVLPNAVSSLVGTPFRADLIKIVGAPRLPSGLSSGRCALLLGEKDAIYTLFQDGRTFRVYAGLLAIEHVEGSSSCP